MIIFQPIFLSVQKPGSGGSDPEAGQKKGKVIKFGWIEGVYVSNEISRANDLDFFLFFLVSDLMSM